VAQFFLTHSVYGLTEQKPHNWQHYHCNGDVKCCVEQGLCLCWAPPNIL